MKIYNYVEEQRVIKGNQENCTKIWRTVEKTRNCGRTQHGKRVKKLCDELITLEDTGNVGQDGEL